MQVHPRSHFAWTSNLDSFCVGEPLSSTDSCSGMQGCVLVYDDVKQISDSTYLGGFCQHFCWHLIFFKNMCNHFWKQQYLMGFCHEIYAGGLISILGVASCYPVGRTLVRLSHINWLGSLASFGLILWYHPQTVYGEEFLLNFLIGLRSVPTWANVNIWY